MHWPSVLASANPLCEGQRFMRPSRKDAGRSPGPAHQVDLRMRSRSAYRRFPAPPRRPWQNEISSCTASSSDPGAFHSLRNRWFARLAAGGRWIRTTGTWRYVRQFVEANQRNLRTLPVIKPGFSNCKCANLILPPHGQRHDRHPVRELIRERIVYPTSTRMREPRWPGAPRQ